MTQEEIEESDSIYNQLQSHPYIKSITAKYHKRIPLLHQNDKDKNSKLLTGSTLSGPHMISPSPLLFTLIDNVTTSTTDEGEEEEEKEKYNELICIYHLGDELCGHPGIVHGGLLLTLLDESLCRCAFPLFETGLGVTASLKIDYLKPCFVDQFVVLHARVDKYYHKKKILVKGYIETLPLEGEGDKVVINKLVEAECLVVEPRSLIL